ncbi:MAG TPA: hypothetical protein VKY74_07485, partial [Chloroflexia bacterium]|nr:hypothetical protein [Chloroflexia bacterium]
MHHHTTGVVNGWTGLRLAALICALGLCGWLILGEPPARGLAGGPAAPAAAAAGPASGAAIDPARGAPSGQPQISAGLGPPRFRPQAHRPVAVLYDQYDYPDLSGISSQHFEPLFQPFDAQAADDFQVPAGQTWTVTSVDVAGGYYGGPGPVDSMNLFFYTNLSTLPDTPVYTATGIVPIPGIDPGDLSIPLDTPVVLTAGRYWVSVQANMAYST